MVAPHSPSLTDTSSWRPQHFGLELVSHPAAAAPSSRRLETLEERQALAPALRMFIIFYEDDTWEEGGDSGRSGRSPCSGCRCGSWHPMLPRFVCLSVLVMALLPLMRGKCTYEAERGSDMLAESTAGTHLSKNWKS